MVLKEGESVSSTKAKCLGVNTISSYGTQMRAHNAVLRHIRCNKDVGRFEKIDKGSIVAKVSAKAPKALFVIFTQADVINIIRALNVKSQNPLQFHTTISLKYRYSNRIQIQMLKIITPPNRCVCDFLYRKRSNLFIK